MILVDFEQINVLSPIKYNILLYIKNTYKTTKYVLI